VLRSTAKNNDGANKISFLAPSVEGQAQVVALALARANLSPEDIGYIEAHGTGTPLGDPIEIEALKKAFGQKTAKRQFCGIGSIKGNIGHPTIASGIAGLLKATLCLCHEKIPGTLHYQKPNPRINFEESPFQVVDRLTPWPRTDKPRIAGISSFGFGGTNVHAIVAEAPLPAPGGASRPRSLVLLSARTQTALDTATANLRDFLGEQHDTNTADMAFTLSTGRRPMAHRRFAVCADAPDTASSAIRRSCSCSLGREPSM
jgi:acyl transferase domain-containing protein